MVNLVNRLKESLGFRPKSLSEKLDEGEVVTFGNEVIVTRSLAEKIGALNQGLLLIADTVAGLPVYLYKSAMQSNFDGFQYETKSCYRLFATWEWIS